MVYLYSLDSVSASTAFVIYADVNCLFLLWHVWNIDLIVCIDQHYRYIATELKMILLATFRSSHTCVNVYLPTSFTRKRLLWQCFLNHMFHLPQAKF